MLGGFRLPALLIGLALSASGLGAPVQAASLEEAMEAQRCIHRCLYNAGGRVTPAYQRCVKRQCNGPQRPRRRG